MPWKETCKMDERSLFISAYLAGEEDMSELCRRFTISRKTGYKWIRRHEEEGFAGLADRSHAPHSSPHRLKPATENLILEIRRAHQRWGPRKVRAWLVDRYPRRTWPAASTIGALFAREGLTFARKKRRRAPASAPFATAYEPNDIWTTDFKGWFRTGDGQRCDPLTLVDASSRYLLRCQALDAPNAACVWPIFDAAFREFGLPKVMRSDNGSPFASVGLGGLSRLSVRLIKTGVAPERIEPGKPEQNGRHERMHLTLTQETASPPRKNRRAQQRAFDDFKRIYNEERPHEALQQKPPARFYTPSPRKYCGRLREPDYAEEILVRRVRKDGEIKWRGQCIYVNAALAGEPVGLEELENGAWRLHYGPVDLAIIDQLGRLVRPQAAPRRRR